MSDTRRPPACHYDRTLDQRVTREHRDDCPNPATHRGCAPCTAPHCTVCGRNHATNDHPTTCPDCQGKVHNDLVDLRDGYAALQIEALDAASDGRLVAAAPIPGGTAAVLVGPTVRLDMVRTSRTMRDDHRRQDPIPAVAVLAQWEAMYRAWLGHAPTRTRPSITRAVAYLLEELPYLANHQVNADGLAGPDWVAFVRQVRSLRAATERVLHDEREPERGVECFECGDQLVRRFRDVRRCRHDTPARDALRGFLEDREVAQDWLRTLATYGLDPLTGELRAAAAPPAGMIAAARRPCGACSRASGGIDDPEPGRSWECPGCRKEYDPGEYATAVRRSLLDDTSEPGEHGWCTLPTAAEAAADISGKPVSAATIRTWVARKDNIGVCCLWRPPDPRTGAVFRFGVQLVYWPDVAARVTEHRPRGRRVRAS